MRTKTVEYDKNEIIISLYNMLNPFNRAYANYDDDIEEKLDELVEMLENKLNNREKEDYDIITIDYIERITYDLDTDKNLKSNK